MATTKKLRYSPSDDQQTASWEAGATAAADALAARLEQVADPDYETPADPDYDDFAQVAYDEPGQVDYDQLADPDPDYGDELAPAPAAAAVVPPPLSAATGFTYALGRAVRPATQQQAHPVVWQGYLKERHPITGLVQRVPVYRLGDGFWDCYREEDLQAA